MTRDQPFLVSTRWFPQVVLKNVYFQFNKRREKNLPSGGIEYLTEVIAINVSNTQWFVNVAKSVAIVLFTTRFEKKIMEIPSMKLRPSLERQALIRSE